MGRFSKLETEKPAEAQPPARPAHARKPPSIEEEVAIPLGPADGLPFDGPGLVARGDEAFFSGESKLALRWYSRALSTDPSCLEAWIAHVRALLLERQLAEAKVWLTRALGIFPDAPALVALRAVTHAMGGMIRQAMGGSDLALAKDNANAAAWMARGHILLIDSNKNAPFCFEQVMKLAAPADWRTPFLIGLIHEDMRQWARAIPFYETACGRRSTLPFAWFRIGRAHAHLGHREASRRAFAQAKLLAADNDRLSRRIENASSGSLMNRVMRLFGWG